MALDLGDARTVALHGKLSPYLRFVLERAAEHALVLHADAISLEHVLTVLMLDEESGAHRAVIFAFADPESLAAESLALSSGILVVGSGSSLPFSPQGVKCLFRAREIAVELACAAVETGHLLAGAVEFVPDEVRARFAEEGLEVPREPSESSTETSLSTAGALFAHFDPDARRALAAACRIARRIGRAAISPAHIAQACLDSDEALARRASLNSARARSVLAGRDEDATRPERRSLPADEALLCFLADLPSNAGTLDLLGALGERGPDEVRQLLRRNKITPDLVERARAAFGDPDPPPTGGP